MKVKNMIKLLQKLPDQDAKLRIFNGERSITIQNLVTEVNQHSSWGHTYFISGTNYSMSNITKNNNGAEFALTEGDMVDKGRRLNSDEA